jgi:hypothetical protein
MIGTINKTQVSIAGSLPCPPNADTCKVVFRISVLIIAKLKCQITNRQIVF